MIQFCRDSKLNVDVFKYLETGLVRNLFIRHKHKLAHLWEEHVYEVVEQPQTVIPVFKVKKEGVENSYHVPYRYLLLPINHIPFDDRISQLDKKPTKMQKCKNVVILQIKILFHQKAQKNQKMKMVLGISSNANASDGISLNSVQDTKGTLNNETPDSNPIRNNYFLSSSYSNDGLINNQTLVNKYLHLSLVVIGPSVFF